MRLEGRQIIVRKPVDHQRSPGCSKINFQDVIKSFEFKAEFVYRNHEKGGESRDTTSLAFNLSTLSFMAS